MELKQGLGYGTLAVMAIWAGEVVIADAQMIDVSTGTIPQRNANIAGTAIGMSGLLTGNENLERTPFVGMDSIVKTANVILLDPVNTPKTTGKTGVGALRKGNMTLRNADDVRALYEEGYGVDTETYRQLMVDTCKVPGARLDVEAVRIVSPTKPVGFKGNSGSHNGRVTYSKKGETPRPLVKGDWIGVVAGHCVTSELVRGEDGSTTVKFHRINPNEVVVSGVRAACINKGRQNETQIVDMTPAVTTTSSKNTTTTTTTTTKASTTTTTLIPATSTSPARTEIVIVPNTTTTKLAEVATTTAATVPASTSTTTEAPKGTQPPCVPSKFTPCGATSTEAPTTIKPVVVTTTAATLPVTTKPVETTTTAATVPASTSTTTEAPKGTQPPCVPSKFTPCPIVAFAETIIQ